MKATHEAELDIPALPHAARHIYIVPDLADKTLLSVSQLCKADCQVVFNDRTVAVHHQGKIVLKGGMQNGSALWKMEIPNGPECTLELTANAAIYFNTAAEIVKFMHAALGYPTLATLDKALAMGLVKGFPGLTQHTLRSHPPFSDATVKGHMAQTRKNVRSTKTPQQKREGEARQEAGLYSRWRWRHVVHALYNGHLLHTVSCKWDHRTALLLILRCEHELSHEAFLIFDGGVLDAFCDECLSLNLQSMYKYICNLHFKLL
jgi:hypothetical protein